MAQPSPTRKGSRQAPEPLSNFVSQSDDDDDDPFECVGKRKRMRTGEARYESKVSDDDKAGDNEDDFQNAQVDPFAVRPPLSLAGPDSQRRSSWEEDI
jgi:hypothetical protein